MSRLEENLQHSTQPKRDGSNWITCVDGFKLSVVTGEHVYCIPRPNWPYDGDEVPKDYDGPFTHAEVGFPSERPEPWRTWEDYCEDTDKPTQTVYGYVPADVIRALIELHGGEAE